MATDDIRPQWLNLARRMQSVACKQSEQGRQAGYMIMETRVLVGADGNPRWWFEPVYRRIEPARGSTEWIDTLFGAGAPAHTD